MTESSATTPYVLYLAVLPKYRTECIRILKSELSGRVKLLASEAHLDKTVRTGIPRDLYTLVKIFRIFGNRAFIQFGSWGDVIAAKTAVLDLNPRSASAWALLLVRLSMRRRTLMWGHIHPQAGPAARTAVLRRTMRKLASGTISYTYRDASKAARDLPGSAVWVAPNSLYSAADIVPASSSPEAHAADSVLYVGRFEPAKKVKLLLEGFALAAEKQPTMRLVLIGGGTEDSHLRSLVRELGIDEKVDFPGWVDDLHELLPYYQRSFCSASPGFAGLGLTQSLGFGVPMLVADNEPHSPEIELDASGGVSYFSSDSPVDLSRALLASWDRRDDVPSVHLSTYTRERYSAEAMAAGLRDALENINRHSS